jgi:hypothetical protein
MGDLLYTRYYFLFICLGTYRQKVYLGRKDCIIVMATKKYPSPLTLYSQHTLLLGDCQQFPQYKFRHCCWIMLRRFYVPPQIGTSMNNAKLRAISSATQD